MDHVYHVQVGQRGVITIPKPIREKSQITEGEIFNIIELSDDVFVISRVSSKIDQIADQIGKEWQDSGISLESMLKTLREVRADYHEKKI